MCYLAFLIVGKLFKYPKRREIMASAKILENKKAIALVTLKEGKYACKHITQTRFERHCLR